MALELHPNQPTPCEITAGQYFWCTCRQSKNFPFCDGSHKGTGKRPKGEHCHEATKVFICGCGKSSNQPFCDGSHKAK